ncbi:MAG: sensor histidine kinase [Myxococcaceae bacterium]
MNGQLSFRRYRAAFFSVVGLLATVTAFTLWNELRTNARIDELFGAALEREALIGRIRVDAAVLENLVDDHIRATNDDARQLADAHMEETLADAKEARLAYTRDLPSGEKELWRRFDDTAHALAQSARVALRFSNRREAERARQHLEAELRPIAEQLNALAGELAHKDAEVTRALLHERESLRTKTTFLGALMALSAVALALGVGASMAQVLRRQEHTIQEQMAELDRRNHELDAFASRVAHDLVSPLSPLRGYLTLIRRSESVTDPDVREMLADAESSATRMAELVEALLRFCRSGKRNEGPPCELDTAVSAILLEQDQVAALNHVVIERKLARHVGVDVPAQLVQSIAQNLISNAVKYSAGRSAAQVVVYAGREGDEAVLEVTDNGPGMTESVMERLYQPFFRAPEARGLPGQGLGLATTKRLVDAHGGTLRIRSATGVGTTATVRFRCVELPRTEPGATPARSSSQPGALASVR